METIEALQAKIKALTKERDLLKLGWQNECDYRLEQVNDARELALKYQADAARWTWLERNVGKWSCTPSPGIWKDAEQIEYDPKCYFSANNTAYGGLLFGDAVRTAILREMDGVE